MRSTKISLTEPVTALRHVKIVECGEELVNYMELCPELVLDRPRFNYRRETLLRKSVAEKLCQASKNLPKGYRLSIIEGWRPQHIQRRMYLGVWNRFKERHPDWSDTKLKVVVNRFTAPLDKRVPPPHSTGGAIDLLLADADGKPVDHNGPYEVYDPVAAPFAAPGLSPEARRHRDMLAEALLPTGITNYPSEYWHWTYGEQGWAYRGGHDHAIYNATQPENYKPDPGDVSEEPLQFIEV